MFPQVVQTLVMIREITNDQLIAYSTCVEVIVWNVSFFFMSHRIFPPHSKKQASVSLKKVTIQA